MATRTIYLTVRLDLDNPNVEEITDEAVDEVVCDLNYGFSAPKGGDYIINDTEICGRNDEGGF